MATEKQKQTGCFIAILFVFILFTAPSLTLKIWSWCAPASLTASDRLYMRQRIEELEEEQKKTIKDIERRRSIKGLDDLIGNSSETWNDRYQSDLKKHRELILAFEKSLKLGVKVAPPKWFRNSYGYQTSPDRAYFDERLESE